MAMWKELKNLFAFLTVLPLRMDMECLVDSARLMFLFPLVGALIGLLSGLFGWVTSLFLPSLLSGSLALGLLLLLTGLHHTDGLLDFGDAVMYHGTAERKIEIMHDQLTGAGAIGLGIMTYLVTALAFGELGKTILIGDIAVPLIIPALIVIELSAKLSMVIAAKIGKAVHKGMSSTFLEAMKGTRGNSRLIAALGLSFIISVPLFWIAGLVTVLTAILSGLVMVSIAHRHFKGVTGDVLGATNEITRMICIVVLLGILG
jgi:adenosylcobinamide-GDP ribazoletransferase